MRAHYDFFTAIANFLGPQAAFKRFGLNIDPSNFQTQTQASPAGSGSARKPETSSAPATPNTMLVPAGETGNLSKTKKSLLGGS